MMASAPGCHGQSTDLQTRARAPAEGMPVDFPARQRAVRSTDLESCSSGLKSRGSKINRVLKFHHSFYKGIDKTVHTKYHSVHVTQSCQTDGVYQAVKPSIAELARRAPRRGALRGSQAARAPMHEIECVERLGLDSLMRELLRERAG